MSLISGSIPISVTDPPPGANPWREVVYGNYAGLGVDGGATNSTLLLQDNATWTTGGSERWATNKISLVTVTDLPSISSKAMRYTWDVANLSCSSDIAIGLNMSLPGGAHVQELWIEEYILFSSNFQIDGGCVTAGRGLKHVFGRTDSGQGMRTQWTDDLRMAALWPNLNYLSGVDYGQTMNKSVVFDGLPHRHRIHFKLGSGASGLNPDGIVRYMFDDTFFYNKNVIPTGGTYMWGVALGRNLNRGPDAAHAGMYCQRYRTRIWNADPGWGW
jgi:hypothetical protein